jgi:PTS system nitrogen regulatory IIA component
MMHSPCMARSPGVDRESAGDPDGAPDRNRGEPRKGLQSSGNSASADACPQLIDLDVDAKDKHELFRIAVAMLQCAHAIDPAPILRALWRREEAGSTGLGKGVAIPHARVTGITEPLTILLRLRTPIAFDAPDGKPVSLALVIIVPADDATEQHLQLLARFASLCTDRTFRTRLLEAADAEDVRSAFIESAAAVD